LSFVTNHPLIGVIQGEEDEDGFYEEEEEEDDEGEDEEESQSVCIFRLSKVLC
jgi:hypothetical protein